MELKIKEILKRNKKVVKLYEDIVALLIFFQVNFESLLQQNKISIEDKNKIVDLKDIHKRERCFIIGNGKSLTIEFLDKIIGEKSFAVNSTFRVYPYTEWRPNYYLITDDHFFDRTGDASYKNEEYEIFFLGTNYNAQIPNTVQLNVNSSNHFLIGTVWNKLFPKLFPVGRFSKNIQNVVYGGKTVVYSAIQIAVFMGFKEIYLIGVDCNYSTKDSHATFIENNEHPKLTQEWADSISLSMLLQFRELSRRLPSDVHVYNLSDIGNLDAFPRRKLEDIL